MTQLRTDTVPPIQHRSVTLIRTRAKETEFATGLGEKREWVSDLKRSDKFLAAWNGQYKTDIFAVEHDALRSALAT